MTWFQIDFDNQCIRAKASDTKSKKKAMQPLPVMMLEKLKPMMGAPDAPILTLPPNYHRGWRTDIEAANIPYEAPAGLAVVHSLRKSFTTPVQEIAGASLSEAQKLARHSTPSLTSNVYTKTANAKLLSLVDALGQKLLALIKKSLGVRTGGHSGLFCINNRQRTFATERNQQHSHQMQHQNANTL